MRKWSVRTEPAKIVGARKGETTVTIHYVGYPEAPYFVHFTDKDEASKFCVWANEDEARKRGGHNDVPSEGGANEEN